MFHVDLRKIKTLIVRVHSAGSGIEVALPSKVRGISSLRRSDAAAETRGVGVSHARASNSELIRIRIGIVAPEGPVTGTVRVQLRQ